MASLNQSDGLIENDEYPKPLLITVRAPATLPAGYTFEAFLNDDPNRPIICEVVRTYKNCTFDWSPQQSGLCDVF
jgi:hypothetical protein